MSAIRRIIRFLAPNGHIYYGEPTLPGYAKARVLTGNLFDGTLQRTDEEADVQKLLAPLQPTDILCIGINYWKHYEESSKKFGVAPPERPVLFMKASSALAGPEDDVLMPKLPHGDQLDWEVELAVVIGKACRDVKKEDALDYVFGYTVGNDVSARHWQRQAGASQWIKGKSFDTFAPLGPCIVTKEEIQDPQKLTLKARVNGIEQQNASTADMIFNVAQIIEWLSTDMTLQPGAVILTGTPQGVAIGRDPPNWLKPGDVVECEVSDIGVLRNRVILHQPSRM